MWALLAHYVLSDRALLACNYGPRQLWRGVVVRMQVVFQLQPSEEASWRVPCVWPPAVRAPNLFAALPRVLPRDGHAAPAFTGQIMVGTLSLLALSHPAPCPLPARRPASLRGRASRQSGPDGQWWRPDPLRRPDCRACTAKQVTRSRGRMTICQTEPAAQLAAGVHVFGNEAAAQARSDAPCTCPLHPSPSPAHLQQ